MPPVCSHASAAAIARCPGLDRLYEIGGTIDKDAGVLDIANADPECLRNITNRRLVQN